MTSYTIRKVSRAESRRAMLASTRVVYGSPVTVKATGQVLTAGGAGLMSSSDYKRSTSGGSSRTPTAQPTPSEPATTHIPITKEATTSSITNVRTAPTTTPTQQRNVILDAVRTPLRSGFKPDASQSWSTPFGQATRKDFDTYATEHKPTPKQTVRERIQTGLGKASAFISETHDKPLTSEFFTKTAPTFIKERIVRKSVDEFGKGYRKGRGSTPVVTADTFKAAEQRAMEGIVNIEVGKAQAEVAKRTQQLQQKVDTGQITLDTAKKSQAAFIDLHEQRLGETLSSKEFERAFQQERKQLPGARKHIIKETVIGGVSGALSFIPVIAGKLGGIGERLSEDPGKATKDFAGSVKKIATANWTDATVDLYGRGKEFVQENPIDASIMIGSAAVTMATIAGVSGVASAIKRGGIRNVVGGSTKGQIRLTVSGKETVIGKPDAFQNLPAMNKVTWKSIWKARKTTTTLGKLKTDLRKLMRTEARHPLDVKTSWGKLLKPGEKMAGYKLTAIKGKTALFYKKTGINFKIKLPDGKTLKLVSDTKTKLKTLKIPKSALPKVQKLTPINKGAITPRGFYGTKIGLFKGKGLQNVQIRGVKGVETIIHTGKRTASTIKLESGRTLQTIATPKKTVVELWKGKKLIDVRTFKTPKSVLSPKLLGEPKHTFIETGRFQGAGRTTVDIGGRALRQTVTSKLKEMMYKTRTSKDPMLKSLLRYKQKTVSKYGDVVSMKRGSEQLFFRVTSKKITDVTGIPRITVIKQPGEYLMRTTAQPPKIVFGKEHFPRDITIKIPKKDTILMTVPGRRGYPISLQHMPQEIIGTVAQRKLVDISAGVSGKGLYTFERLSRTEAAMRQAGHTLKALERSRKASAYMSPSLLKSAERIVQRQSPILKVQVQPLTAQTPPAFLQGIELTAEKILMGRPSLGGSLAGAVVTIQKPITRTPSITSLASVQISERVQKPFTIPISTTMTHQALARVPITKTSTVSQQVQVSQQITEQITSPVSMTPPKPPTMPKMVIPKIPMIKIPLAFPLRFKARDSGRKRVKSRIKGLTKYMPSVVAKELKLFAPRKRLKKKYSEGLTGLEIRAIPI